MTTEAQTIPDDIFQTACGIVMEAKSLKSMLKHKDVVDAIAFALAAEREKAAVLADTVEVPGSDLRMKLAIKVAARAIRRGRHLTAEEKLANVQNWLASEDV